MATTEPAVTAALTEALLQLLPTVEPARAESALRKAIATLVAASNRPLVERGPMLQGGDVQSWLDLKVRIRNSGVALAEIARQLSMSKSAVDHVLSPAGRVPSKATFDKLKAWLEARPPAAGPTTSIPVVTANAVSQAAATESVPPRTLAAPGPGRLSQEERIAISALSPHQAKQQLGISDELRGRAAAGAILPADLRARLSARLAAD